MEHLDHFYGYFNLVLGILCILIGFKIYKPFKGEDGENKFHKMKTFYRLAGIGPCSLGTDENHLTETGYEAQPQYKTCQVDH